VAVQPAHAGAVGGIKLEFEDDAAGGKPRLDCRRERIDPRPGHRRNQHRPFTVRPALGDVLQPRALGRVEPVDLVPHLNQRALVPGVLMRIDAKLPHRAIDEQLALRDAGVWGHYVADASQPLHISVHFNGWGKYPNPQNYSTSTHVHDLFETEFVNRYVSQSDVARLLLPSRSQSSNGLVGDAAALRSIGAYLRGSNAAVVRLYDIEKTGGFARGTPEARQFTAGRLAYGASELRDLIVSAWQVRTNVPIGDDFPQRVGDIVSGKVPYRNGY